MFPFDFSAWRNEGIAKNQNLRKLKNPFGFKPVIEIYTIQKYVNSPETQLLNHNFLRPRTMDVIYLKEINSSFQIATANLIS